MNIELTLSEVNAAIALFSGVAEKIREQAVAQSQPPEMHQPPSEALDQTTGGTD